jgi:hypothetical protein
MGDAVRVRLVPLGRRMTHTLHTVTFHGGPADGRTLDVPAIGLAAELHILVVSPGDGGLLLYLDPREFTTTYRRRAGDEHFEYDADEADDD